MERHLQTLLLTLVAGLITWQGVTTLKLTEGSARQDERIINLTAQVAQLRGDLRDWNNRFYLKADAERELGDIDADLGNLRDRVSALEER